MTAVDASAETVRARAGRAPDVFEPGGWVPMREHRDGDEVDFAIVGTGAGGATLAAKLAEAGFSVVAFDAGPFWRPLEDFASDETEQKKLFWMDDRLTGGADPVELGANNSGRGVGGSTVHFSMVSLRFRPELFKAASLLGYGADWPVTYAEMAPYSTRSSGRSACRGPSATRGVRRAGATPIASIRSMRPGCCLRAARRRWASNGRRRRLRPFRRRAENRRPASIAASAFMAARPMPSRAR